MDGMTDLDNVLQQAHMVRVSPVSGYGVDGFIWVDLADPAELGTQGGHRRGIAGGVSLHVSRGRPLRGVRPGR